MKDYYNTNKNSLVEIRTSGVALANSYDFQKITIRKKSGELELMFHGGSRNNVTMYLNPTSLNLISEHVVEGCSSDALQRYRTMYQSSALRLILSRFEQISPKAIRISDGGIFVALGGTLKSANPNLEGGILMTMEPEVNNTRIVEQIDTNVYLYDDLIY
ncbi:hypothetical protein [Pseudochryseolinea flava]|nr:hypothetical protein [Pseudochryseolinea flava]